MPRSKISQKKYSEKTQSEFRFCLALYDHDDYNRMENDKQISYMCKGDEICPTTDRFHYQVYIETKQIRLGTLFKRYPKTSFRRSNGKLLLCKYGPTANKAYAHKDGVNLYERGEAREWKGKLSDKELYCPDIGETLKPWQKNIIYTVSRKADDRDIYWLWSEGGGVGKTTFAKYLFCTQKDCIMLEGKAADIRNGILTYRQTNKRYPNIVVVNIPRCRDNQFVSWEGLENIKDMFFYSGKYEGGMICGPNPHLIVFSNSYPQVPKMSADRWNIYEIPTPTLPQQYLKPKILDWGTVIAPVNPHPSGDGTSPTNEEISNN